VLLRCCCCSCAAGDAAACLCLLLLCRKGAQQALYFSQVAAVLLVQCHTRPGWQCVVVLHWDNLQGGWGVGGGV
jgi:hypothetical protein